MSDPLPLAVRGYAVAARTDEKPEARKPKAAKSPRRAVETARRPPAILVFDCETTTDATQALLFGCYRYYRLRWTAAGPKLVCVEEGLFHADDLAERDRDGLACIEAYVRRRQPVVASEIDDAVRPLRVLSRGEFVEQVLWKALSAQATVVTFNAPFDLSRLALSWSEARSKHFRGGFSLTLFSHEKDGELRENRYRPRLLLRSLDSKRARVGLGRARPGSDPDAKARGRGSFLDLHTLAYALSGDSHSLESACAAFAVPFEKRAVEHGRITPEYIDYCREDVGATATLYRALAAEYERWELQLAPTRAYSPASLAKAHLREAGVLADPRAPTRVPEGGARLRDDLVLRRPRRMPDPSGSGAGCLLRLRQHVPDRLRAHGPLALPRLQPRRGRRG